MDHALASGQARAGSPGSGWSAREERLAAACGLHRPDRVPVAPLVHCFPAVGRGFPRRVMHYDLARRIGNPRVFIALHRGSAGFMSNEQFARFYWPSLKALLLGLIDAGLVPMAFFEGDYTPRLKFLGELPPGKIIGHFDRIDRQEARRALGGVMCFWGNVPASVLCAGTVDEVKREVWELMDLFAEGGLILDGSIGIPDEAKPENVLALTQAAREG